LRLLVLYMDGYWDIIARIIKESDLVLEVLDARLVELSRNDKIEEMVEEIGRPMLFVINKSDLVSKESLNAQVKELKKKGDVLFVSAKKPKDVKVLLYAIKKIFKKHGKREATVRVFGDPKLKTREAKAEIVVGILGYPNVGKSSIINAMAHKKKVKVSKKAGTTHGIHWVKATNEIKLIDSPGVIPLVKGDEIRYGLIGAKTDRIRDPGIISHAIIKLFLKSNPKKFSEFYGIEINEDVDDVVEQIGRKKSYILKGDNVDEFRTSSDIIRDWQSGKLRL